MRLSRSVDRVLRRCYPGRLIVLRARLLRGALLLALTAGCHNGEHPAAASRSGTAQAQGVDPGPTWKPSRLAEVYFSTEVDGYVEPCGCTTRPLGGLPRLASVLARGLKDRVLVDAGDLLFPTGDITDVNRAQHLLKSRILARAYRRLGAVALNLGESDFTAGTDLLKDLQREGAVPFVSANLRPVGDSGPIVARSIIRNIGGIRVGITGVATPETVDGVDGVAAIEYGPAVRAEVSAMLRGGAELIVVLAHTGDLGARELAKAVPEIDVIIRAPGTPIGQPPHGPERVGNAVIVEAGSQGQHIGRLTLAFGPLAPERPIMLDDGGRSERRQREQIARKIDAYQMDIDAWINDPAKAAAVEGRRAQIARLRAQPTATASGGQTGPHVRLDLIALGEEIPSDPDMSRVLDAYYGQLREMNLEKGELSLCAAPADPRPVFVGTDKCIDCHEDEYAFWKKTKHAHAWGTLEGQGKHFDLTCVGCHTVGYQRPGGFCRLKDVGVLKNVGCESCHGPGSKHLADKSADSIQLRVTADTCKSYCHVSTHSDAFVFEKYVREITGPGHELSGAKEGGD